MAEKSTMQKLHDEREINCSIASFYDKCWSVKLGDEMNGFTAETIVRSFEEAEAWLEAKTRDLYPAGSRA